MSCVQEVYLQLKLIKSENCSQVIVCKFASKIACDITCKTVFSTNKYHWFDLPQKLLVQRN